MKAAPQILVGLLLSFVPPGCVGDELSGGDSLSSGGADGTGSSTASGSGGSDNTQSATGVNGCIAAADPNVVLAYQSMLTDLATTRDGLASRRLAAEELITAAFGVSTLADVREVLSTSTAGRVEHLGAPVFCPGTLAPSEASAVTCAPDVEVRSSCSGLGRECSLVCESPFVLVGTEFACQGSCAGACILDVASACEGTCLGTCSGQCACEAANGDCAGKCDGMCEGTCELGAGGSCSGACAGSCTLEGLVPDLPVFEGLWCADCSGDPSDCDGAVDLGRLGFPCHAIGQAAGLAHADCVAPPISDEFEVSLELGRDPDARNEFKTALRSARPGFAELLAVIEHVDRFDDVAVPPLCSAPGQNAYNDLRDELGLIRSAARSALLP